MRPITIAIGNSGLTKPLKDGSVRPDGLNLQYIQVDPIIAAMRRMARGLEFDICEMAFTTYLCAKALGAPITAIPVFLTRNFHHRAIFCNAQSGVTSPKDLEGKTVGVNRGYTVTTGLWARGILETEYGVNLNKITWAATNDEHVAEYKAPANVDYSYIGQSIVDLLLTGKISAAVGDIRTDSPDIHPLIPNAREAGFAYFRKTGIYPINHGLVVKDSLLNADPELAPALFSAFKEAKKTYLAHLESGKDLSAGEKDTVAVQQVVGDPLPFGIRNNKRALETLVQFAVDQQIIPRKFGLEELFEPRTRDID